MKYIYSLDKLVDKSQFPTTLKDIKDETNELLNHITYGGDTVDFLDDIADIVISILKCDVLNRDTYKLNPTVKELISHLTNVNLSDIVSIVTKSNNTKIQHPNFRPIKGPDFIPPTNDLCRYVVNNEIVLPYTLPLYKYNNGERQLNIDNLDFLGIPNIELLLVNLSSFTKEEMRVEYGQCNVVSFLLQYIEVLHVKYTK